MNVPAEIVSIGQQRLRSSHFARWARRTGAMAAIVVGAVACGGAPADGEAVASGESAFATNPWPTTWSTSGPGTRSVKDDAGRTTIHYDSREGKPGGGAGATWRFETKAPADADLTFTWDYSLLHAWYQAYARVTAFADGPNGAHVEIPLVGKNGKQSVWDYVQFSNTYDTALRVSGGYSYGYIVEGENNDSSQILQGDLNVQYRVGKIVKSVQFGGAPWPSSSSALTNFVGMAPAGAFVSEVRAYWSGNVIMGVSWAYSDNSCVHAGPCSAGTIGQFCIPGPFSPPICIPLDSNNFTMNESERLGECTIRDSGFGYRSVRHLTLTKHPAMDPTQKSSVEFGPDKFDSQRTTDTNGDSLLGFYGVTNNDGFLTSIGLITQKTR